MTSQRQLGERAVVLGGSMAGLLAAGVLSDFYRTVTVVERDVLPDSPENRRGVPQGRHVHALLGRGGQVIDEIFPGFLAEWAADGGEALDDGDFSRVYVSIGGHLMVRSGRARQRDAMMYLSSRPFLEYHVRRRLLALPNVTLLDGHDIVDLTAEPSGGRVTGVMVAGREHGERRWLGADLVVDATGRGSRTPAFLETIGYQRPFEDQVAMRTCYASRQLRMPRDAAEPMVVIGAEPGRTTGMFLSRYENDQWVFTVWGMLGQEPPADLTGMVAYATGFAPPHIAAALRTADPVGEATRHRMPSSQWRRYDRLHRFPAGLLVCGDAISSFNPVHGQGMTVAALDALAMRDALRGGTRDLPGRYFRGAAKSIGIAWRNAAGTDLGLPEVTGRRTAATRITNRCADWVLTACETDAVVAERFFRVSNLLDPPSRLLRPSFAVAVLKANRHNHRPTLNTVQTLATEGAHR